MAAQNARNIDRSILSFVDELSVVGGLARSLVAIFYCIYIFFGTPFRMLDLAVSFQKLKEMSQKRKRVLTPCEEAAEKFDDHITWNFYARLFCFQMLPPCFKCCFDKNAKMETHSGSDHHHHHDGHDHNPTFIEMYSHYEELINQVQYELSLKKVADQAERMAR